MPFIGLGKLPYIPRLFDLFIMKGLWILSHVLSDLLG